MATNLVDRTPAVRSAKTTSAVALILVFLVGGVAGALVMDFWVHNPSRAVVSSFDTPAGKAAYFEHIKKELDLTPAQTEQMESVLNDFWQYYRTVLSDSKQRVEQILDADQRKKFDKMLQQQLQQQLSR
jgi:uncharacterized membrane protein